MNRWGNEGSFYSNEHSINVQKISKYPHKIQSDEWCYFIIYILVLCAVSLNTSLSKNDKSVFTTSLCSKILKNAKYRGVTKTSKSPFLYKLKIIWWIWSLKLPQNFKKKPQNWNSRHTRQLVTICLSFFATKPTCFWLDKYVGIFSFWTW